MKTIKEKRQELQRQEDLKNANYLAKRLKEHNDKHSQEMREIYLSFINDPTQDIRVLIDTYKTEPELPYCFMYDFGINDTYFEICYPYYLVEAENDKINTLYNNQYELIS